MYLRSRKYTGLSGSGSMQWYLGQHAKVRDAIKNGDLKAAIEAGTQLNDLGISGKTYEQVINSAELLQAFKNAILVTHAPAGFYKDVAPLVAPLIDQIKIGTSGPTISASEEQAILQKTLPSIQSEGNFLTRNMVPILLGGTVLVLGVVGMVLLIQV